MQDYEKQLAKFLKKRDAVLDRMEKDKAEVDKLNAQIGALQLAKIREALGCDELGLLEIINKHPEQLERLRDSAGESNKNIAPDDAETVGQTSFFEDKHNPYSD